MKVYILGGGPAGLAIAQAMAEDARFSFVVVERGPTIGGLAQTVRWGEHGRHDLGPHKIFTLDRALMRRVEALLPESNWLTRPKKSSIFMRGRFLPYPPSPFSLSQVYGPAAFARIVLDFGLARLRSSSWSGVPRTFQEDLERRVGRSLYELLFKPIALKLWGDPANLDIKLSQGRVQTPSVLEALARLAGVRRSNRFEALEFQYPRGGLQTIWNAIASRCAGHGEIQVNREVVRLEVSGGRIGAIHVKDQASGEECVWKLGEDDFVFSTLPLLLLLKALGEAIESKVHHAAEAIIQLNDLILVFLKIDRPSLLDESWVFVPDPEISFHRLSEQESFDPGMTPDGSIVCAEIMSHERRPMSRMSDAELIDAVRQGIVRMGYDAVHLRDARVIRLPRSYPVYRPGFEGKLADILAALDGIANLRSVGRQGAFNYIGTLDAMDIGFGAARWLFESRPADRSEAWTVERRRTSHYPVLD